MNAHSDATSLAGRLDTRLPFFYGWVIVYVGFVIVFIDGEICRNKWGLRPIKQSGREAVVLHQI